MQPVTFKDLMLNDINEHEARRLLPLINSCLQQDSPEKRWQYATHHILSKQQSFNLHFFLYTIIYGSLNSISFPAWFPSEQIIAQANLTKLLQAQSCANYQALHQWSLKKPDEFWAKMISTLSIIFKKPYEHICSLEEGVTTPYWLPGARFNIVDSCFQGENDATAIVYQAPGENIAYLSYAELERLTNRVANSLKLLNLSKGDAVAINMNMTKEAVAIYLGIIKAGFCAVGIAESFAAGEIQTRFEIATVKAIFCHDILQRQGKQLPLYEKICLAQAPKAIVVPIKTALQVQLRPQDTTWQDFLVPNDEFTSVSCRAETFCNILFSSGTTSTPKAIPWTHTTPLKTATDAHLYQNVKPGDVLAWPTSLGWMMGPWLVFAALLNRASIALFYDAPHQTSFGQFIENSNTTLLGVVPSLVSAWRQAKSMEPYDWSSIKVFSSTGECSNPEDMLYLMYLGNYKPIIEYCGGTEIGGAYITSTVLTPNLPSIFTVPTLGLDFYIMDEKGRPSTEGETALLPPSIGLSNWLLNKDHHAAYYKDMPAHPDGRVLRYHGDVYRQLDYGYRAMGRADDTMNLGGIKISSALIESALLKLPNVNEVAAISITSPEGGPEKLCVYIVLNEKSTATVDSLKQAAQTLINTHVNPLFKLHALLLIEALPRTASNKVMRRQLRNLAIKGIVNKP